MPPRASSSPSPASARRRDADGPGRSRCAGRAARRGALLVLALAAALQASSAGAQLGRSALGERPIDDVLQVQLLDRELLALDALGGSGPRERLEIGESLLWSAARGRVGVAVTDRRMLAVGVASGSWQSARYQYGELPPEDAYLGDRVGLLLTSKRALGFDGSTGNLVEKRLGVRERLLGFDVSANVAVVVTDRRALGLSPFAGGFFTKRIRSHEQIESVEASGNLATVITDRRLLTFRAPAGSWGERSRNLR